MADVPIGLPPCRPHCAAAGMVYEHGDRCDVLRCGRCGQGMIVLRDRGNYNNLDVMRLPPEKVLRG